MLFSFKASEELQSGAGTTAFDSLEGFVPCAHGSSWQSLIIYSHSRYERLARLTKNREDDAELLTLRWEMAHDLALEFVHGLQNYMVD